MYHLHQLEVWKHFTQSHTCVLHSCGACVIKNSFMWWTDKWSWCTTTYIFLNVKQYRTWCFSSLTASFFYTSVDQLHNFGAIASVNNTASSHINAQFKFVVTQCKSSRNNAHPIFVLIWLERFELLYMRIQYFKQKPVCNIGIASFRLGTRFVHAHICKILARVRMIQE